MSNNAKIQVRDLRTGDWLWTHKNVLFSQFLSASDFKVYCGLASYAGNEDQKSFPSMVTLAGKLNMGKSTVLRSLKVLEDHSLIRVDRREGTSNLYFLLQADTIEAPPDAPVKVKKEQSVHHKLIQFWHEKTQYYRGLKPTYSPKDAAHLKRVLSLEILTEGQIQQLMVFYLASSRFKKFAPVLSVFFSGGIFTGLHNQMLNYPEFWKELDGYLMQNPEMLPEHVNMNRNKLRDMVAQLSAKLSMDKTNKQKEHA